MSSSLLVFAGLTLGGVLLLLLRVLPGLDASAAQQRVASERVGQVQMLVAGAANDQRGYLLTGAPEFLDEMRDKSRRATSLTHQMLASSSRDTTAQLRSALEHFHEFLRTHEQVKALVRADEPQEAITLAVTTGREQRKAAQRDFTAAEERLLESAEEQSDSQLAVATWLGIALVLLSVFLAGASTAVRRGIRRQIEADAARRHAETNLVREQRSVALLQALTEAGDDLGAAFLVCLEGVCAGTGWEIGHAYVRDEGGLSGSSECWWLTDADRFSSFAAATGCSLRGAEARGAGPADGVPAISVTSSLADPRLDDRVAVALGLRQTVSVTVTGGPGTSAVLEFFSTDPAPPDRETTAVLRHAAAHLQRLLERDRATARLRELAVHDALTGLGNRTLLREQIGELVRKAASEVDHGHALVVLDLDDFKLVNDSLGHTAGDGLLVAVAERLRGVVGSDGVVVRLGGDVFAVLLGAVSEEEAIAAGERILGQFYRDFAVAEHALRTTASVGIAVGSPDRDGADLLRNADLAMYAAKAAGKGKLAVYRPEMLAQARQRLDMENHLRHALQRGEMHLAYQPIVDARSGDLHGLEALLRWQHPILGSVSPAKFIPVAEMSGTIVSLGEWALRTACRDAVELADRRGGPVGISVNVSARQLQAPGFLAAVRSVLHQSGLAPALLTLEVTESLLLRDDHATAGILRELHELGVRVAIDDFGTGYSSLARLRGLPVAELKIDRAFIKEVDVDGEAGAIVHAIIAMARALGLSVVAEGLETQAQLQALRRLGCDAIQGFLVSRPLPWAELELPAAPVSTAASRPAEVLELVTRRAWSQEAAPRIPLSRNPYGAQPEA